MPEEELDDLFRKAASEFHPEFDPVAWQAMEKKLDAYRPHPGFWQRVTWLTGLFLTMGLGFWVSLWWLHRQEAREGLLVPTHTEAPRPGVQPPSSPADRKPVSAARPENSRRPEPTGIAAGPAASPSISKSPSLSKPQAANQAPAGKAASPAVANTLPQRERSRRSRLPLAPGGQKSLPPAVGQQPLVPPRSALPPAGNEPAGQAADRPIRSRTDSQATALPATTDLPATENGKPAPAFTGPALTLPATNSLDQAAGVADSPDAVSPDSAANHVPRGWSRLAMRLLLAPDLSMVGFARPQGISTNAGIVLSYQFAPRWSLATGVVKARKVYSARPEDYRRPGYWNYTTQPYDIDAVCRVLDVPLNIGFLLVRREKSTVTLSTGVSSYWMLSEDYDYAYRDSTGYTYTKTWGVHHQNRHLFSIYNLSALYSHRLTPALTWGIEPFIKVPLTGVGAGRVKLASGGVFISLGYQLR